MTDIGTATLYCAANAQTSAFGTAPHCFHLEFTVEELEKFDFQPGQFVSSVALDPAGKQQTRAYSIASAPRANQFDVCVNRVEGGFFSNLLCDLEVGQSLQFHGPHGLFLLRAPLTDSIFIATGTGIAPMRGFVEHLFPDDGEDRSQGRKIWLVYGTRYESELYYEDYFERVAASRPNFFYLKTLSRAAGWLGRARVATCRNWWSKSPRSMRAKVRRILGRWADLCTTSTLTFAD